MAHAAVLAAVRAQELLEQARVVDFLPPLLMRLYVAPVFWMAGSQKLAHFESTVEWFGNPEWGLGLPLPALMAFLATAAELGGAFALLLGVALRWMCIPLMVTMVVAAVTVHWQHGWLAIATGSGLFATDRTMEAVERLDRAESILREHGDYSWLTEHGNFVVLNNGIEFAVTYFLMLLALFYTGAGRWFSVDHWVRRAFMPK